MTVGGLHNNRPQYGMVHHPYDPTVEDDDGYPVLRDVPEVGRIAWEQESGSAGRFVGCVSASPNSDRQGGGTWPGFQMGESAALAIAVTQGSDLTIIRRVSGARRHITERTSAIESGRCLLEQTIEIDENASAGNLVVTIDTSETGWEWLPASTTQDYPVGTFQIKGVANGWIYAEGGTTAPIVLKLTDAGGADIGDTVTLSDGDFLMIHGSLLYTAFPL